MLHTATQAYLQVTKHRFHHRQDLSTTPDALKALQKALEQTAEKRKQFTERKFHASFLHRKQIKRALRLFNQDQHPPMPSLRATSTSPATASPSAMADLLCTAFAHLGGPPDHSPPPALVSSLLHHLPRIPHPTTLPPIRWADFSSRLNKASPWKSPGPDGTNLYMLSICPEWAQKTLWRACNLHLHLPLPTAWCWSYTFLLFKSGDPQLPQSYRPISLLNSLYKLLASHLLDFLARLCAAHHLIHDSQFGARPNHQTLDHIHHLRALTSISSPCLHLYVDFNKAFNSIPHSALWQLLSHLQVPPTFLTILRAMYATAQEFPLVHNQPYSSFHLTRGLRQGCPLSPLLFCLYANLFLFPLSALIATNPHSSLHAFMDDILIRSPDPQLLTQALHFLHTDCRALGLDLNLSKTKLHFLCPSLPTTSPPTLPADLQPLFVPPTLSSGYTYLGVFLADHPSFDHVSPLRTLISAFFAQLHQYPLLAPEKVHLANIQLIPRLLYRLSHYQLPFDQLRLLQTHIWSCLTSSSNIPKYLSPKDRYLPRRHGGLGLQSLLAAYATHLINFTQRFLLGRAPPRTIPAVIHSLSSASPSTFQASLIAAARFAQICTHGFGEENPCPPSDLPPFSRIYVQFSCSSWYPCDLVSQNPTMIKEPSLPATYRLLPTHRFSLSPIPNTPPSPPPPALPPFPGLTLPSLHLPSDPFTSPLPFQVPPAQMSHLSSHNPPPPPLGASFIQATAFGYLFRLPSFNPALPAHLREWGLTEVADLLNSRNSLQIYLDGSYSQQAAGYAFAVFPINDPFTYVFAAPLTPVSSFLSEWFALWAACSFLSLQRTPPPTLLLGDSAALYKPTTSTTPRSLWQLLLQHHLSSLPIQLLWVRAHIGIPGNEVVDIFSKWASVLHPPSSFSPSPSPSLSYHTLPLLLRLRRSHFFRLLPHHQNSSLLLPQSFHWYSHSPPLSIWPLKWTTATISIAGYPPRGTSTTSSAPFVTRRMHATPSPSSPSAPAAPSFVMPSALPPQSSCTPPSNSGAPKPPPWTSVSSSAHSSPSHCTIFSFSCRPLQRAPPTSPASSTNGSLL